MHQSTWVGQGRQEFGPREAALANNTTRSRQQGQRQGDRSTTGIREAEDESWSATEDWGHTRQHWTIWDRQGQHRDIRQENPGKTGTARTTWQGMWAGLDLKCLGKLMCGIGWWLRRESLVETIVLIMPTDWDGIKLSGFYLLPICHYWQIHTLLCFFPHFYSGGFVEFLLYLLRCLLISLCERSCLGRRSLCHCESLNLSLTTAVWLRKPYRLNPAWGIRVHSSWVGFCTTDQTWTHLLWIGWTRLWYWSRITKSNFQATGPGHTHPTSQILSSCTLKQIFPCWCFDLSLNLKYEQPLTVSFLFAIWKWKKINNTPLFF